MPKRHSLGPPWSLGPPGFHHMDSVQGRQVAGQGVFHDVPPPLFDPDTPCLLLNREERSAFSRRNMVSHFPLKHGALLDYILFFSLLTKKIVCSHKKRKRKRQEKPCGLGRRGQTGPGRAGKPKVAAMTWRVQVQVASLIFVKKPKVWICMWSLIFRYQKTILR